MRYDYYVAMQNDIRQYITDNVDLTEWVGNREGLETVLCDELWTEDSVTGNGSGSYTFDRQTAKEYVTDNVNLVGTFVHEFGCTADEVTRHFYNEDWEWFDVSIRCYLLTSVVGDVLDAMEWDGAFEETETA